MGESRPWVPCQTYREHAQTLQKTYQKPCLSCFLLRIVYFALSINSLICFNRLAIILDTINDVTSINLIHICFDWVGLFFLATPGTIYVKLPYIISKPTPSSLFKGLLVVPRGRLVNYGERSFSYAAPKLWNEIPEYIRKSETLSIFKTRLKTYLFRHY